MGGLKPNTVIFGWPNGWRQSIEEDRSWRVFVDAIHTAAANKMALIVPKGIASFPDSNEKVHIIYFPVTVPNLIYFQKSEFDCIIQNNENNVVTRLGILIRYSRRFTATSTFGGSFMMVVC